MADPQKFVVTGFDTSHSSNHSATHYVWNKPVDLDMNYKIIMKFYGVYRTYSETDLEEMKRMREESINRSKKLKDFDTDALFATF